MTDLMNVRTVVTQDMIDYGEQGQCGRCPIALALREAVPGARHVEVRDGRASFALDSIYWDAKMPQDATTFVRRFDRFGRDYVEPAEFNLTFVPEERRP